MKESFGHERNDKRTKGKVSHLESKEFQMKINWPAALGKAKLTPGATDGQLFLLETNTLKVVTGRLTSNQKGKTEFKDNLWRREGIRYDTPDSSPHAHNLTLAVEATNRAWGSATLLESELSFKVEKSMKGDWEYRELNYANQLYFELQKTSVFLPAPPIFFYQDPVPSVNIKVLT